MVTHYNKSIEIFLRMYILSLDQIPIHLGLSPEDANGSGIFINDQGFGLTQGNDIGAKQD